MRPAVPPGGGLRPPGRGARPDAIAIAAVVFSGLFLVAGAIAVAVAAYIASNGHPTPRGEPIFWSGVAGLATGAALMLIARLR